MKVILFIISLFVFSCSTEMDTDSNELVLNAHSMVYDAEDAKVYLFGGANEKEVINDLWVLEDEIWKKIKTGQSPAPRTFASMVYDKIDNRIILFGGSKVLFGRQVSSSNLLNDTWEFKDGSWNKIITPSSPPPRAEAEIVFNPENGTIILFGGYYINNGEYIKLDDTWEFKNNDWIKVSSVGPSPRHGVSMEYDFMHQYILLFGGSTVDKQYGEASGQSWIFKNQIWSYLDINQPPGVFNASMIYDRKQGQFIRFGGWNGSSRINETWSFKDNVWKQIYTETSPAPRNHSQMIYNEKTGATILFGGHNGKEIFGDLWEFKDNQWKKILDVKPKSRIENNH